MPIHFRQEVLDVYYFFTFPSTFNFGHGLKINLGTEIFSCIWGSSIPTWLHRPNHVKANIAHVMSEIICVAAAKQLLECILGLRKSFKHPNNNVCSRVDDWFLMSSPWPTAAMCVLYYYVIRVAGPRFMKDREPYDTKRIQIVYNLIQTLLSLWIWLKTASYWLTGRYNWLCQPVDYSGRVKITNTISNFLLKLD